MEQKKSEFNKVLNAWDVLVIAFGAMIGWGWVVSTGGWIENGRVLGAFHLYTSYADEERTSYEFLIRI